MPQHSDETDAWTLLHDRIIGLGEQSARKSYYPELQRRLLELEEIRRELHENNLILEQEIAYRQMTQEALEMNQRELRAINESLAERVAQGIAQLRQKDEMLLHQSRLAAMGELLHCIAHQWRQPLNNIAAQMQAMQFLKHRGELTDEEMDKDISAVMDILKYMSSTINDFRNFYRTDRTMEFFSLQTVVEQALSLVHATLTEARIAVSVNSEDKLQGYGQANEYAQILMNIIINARDVLVERAMESPEIKISIFSRDSNSVVTVEDNGGGISPEIITQVFEPYFSTKGPAQGTGIGLYMSKMIIERNMGGTLTVRNSSEGALFRIALPTHKKE